MLNYLVNRFRRSAVRTDALMRQSRDDHQVVNAQFVSFLENSGFRKRMIAKQSRFQRLRRLIGIATMWALAFGVIWVIIESAHALELF